MQQQKTYELLIAVSEVTTNAINSHIEARTSKPITLNYKFKKDSVTVEVADKGTGFNPKKLEPLPKVTDPERLLHESGLGISLYKSYTDDHRIKSSSNGTRVLITKNYS